MRKTFEVEVRESNRAGYEPSLRGVMLTEGRAASGGRAEVFANNSVSFPSEGVGIMVRHRGTVEVRAHPVRQRNGELTIRSRATRAIREAVESGRRFMSVEFQAIEERTTRGGVREVLRAFVDRAALVSSPEFDTTRAEIRSAQGEISHWLCPPQQVGRWLGGVLVEGDTATDIVLLMEVAYEHCHAFTQDAPEHTLDQAVLRLVSSLWHIRTANERPSRVTPNLFAASGAMALLSPWRVSYAEICS